VDCVANEGREQTYSRKNKLILGKPATVRHSYSIPYLSLALLLLLFLYFSPLPLLLLHHLLFFVLMALPGFSFSPTPAARLLDNTHDPHVTGFSKNWMFPAPAISAFATKLPYELLRYVG